jgi:rubrerythrin
LNVAVEQEAIHQYMAHAEAAYHHMAKRVLMGLANEEREYGGEFTRLFEILTDDEDQWLAIGRDEVHEFAADVD